MAEVQDEDNWLYGDEREHRANELEREENGPKEKLDDKTEEPEKGAESNVEEKNEEPENLPEEQSQSPIEEREATDKEPAVENGDAAESENGDKDDDSSSGDDEPTVTIGKIVKQPDIIRPPPPTHRAAPTTGPKDEDFENVGKVNGVPITDLNLGDLEEKPWRKPGADLSDYFNYGFTEDTWMKYCERQKSIRLQDSFVGLGGLGGGSHKLPGLSSIPVSITNENSKYGGIRITKSTYENVSELSAETEGSTIQVMTAEKRTYSNKVIANNSGGFDGADYSTPPPFGNFYNRPPPGPFFGAPPPYEGNAAWNVPSVPPPGWTPEPVPAPQLSPTLVPFYDEEISRGHSRERDVERDRGRERERDPDRDRDTERHRSRERESRRTHRRRSRSRSRSRHRKRSKSRSSRSRSPSHRHKSKRRKRERDSE